MSLVLNIVHLDCSYNLILCRCDGFVTMLKCSGLAVISSYPLLEPKFTKFKNAACPDNLAGTMKHQCFARSSVMILCPNDELSWLFTIRLGATR